MRLTGIEDVAQTVAQEVEAEDGDAQFLCPRIEGDDGEGGDGLYQPTLLIVSPRIESFADAIAE